MKHFRPTIIITGVAGFIGSHLADKLLSLGYRIIGIDNFVRGTKSNIRQLFADYKCQLSESGSSYFQLLELDIADYDVLRLALQPIIKDHKIQAIWHLAANSDISQGVNDPAIDLRDTFMTTFNVLRIMDLYGIKQIIFSSTSAIYGNLNGVMAEDIGPLFPISNYGAMKLASEASISAFLEKCLDRAWIYRFPNVVGSRATHGVIYDFFHKIKKTPHLLEVLGDGSQSKPYLHVGDLIDAMIYIWENAKEKLNYFNIGQFGSATTVKYIAEQVVKKVGTNVKIVYGAGNKGWVGDIPTFAYNVDKLSKLGWLPSMESNASVDKAINEIYKEIGF